MPRPAMVPSVALTFRQFQEHNRIRCVTSFDHSLGDDGWVPEQWMNAALGELGEAANLIKKQTRLQLPGDHEVTNEMVIEELADAVTYIDLLVTKLGGNLGDAVAAKFNKVNERVGYGGRLFNPHDHR